MLVSSRDFLFLSHHKLETDGSIASASISVEDPRAPPAKPHVRGRIIVLELARTDHVDCGLENPPG